MKILVLTAAEVRQAIRMKIAIDVMKTAFRDFSMDNSQAPLRSKISADKSNGTVLLMPAITDSDLAIKIVSVFDNNHHLALPLIHAMIIVLDVSTGKPLALLEGGSITAIRTGAASGAATDVLARNDAKSVAIIGSGVQARTQLEAVCTVRKIEKAWVYSPNTEHVEIFASEMSGREPIPDDLCVVTSSMEAIQDADIICTATTSNTPVFDGNYIKKGTHVNAIGSFTPKMQEVDSETIRKSLVVVDSRQSVLSESGDLIIPIEANIVKENHIHAELGEIISNKISGRTDKDQITCFKSCGVAVQDVAAAQIVVEEAKRLGLGTVVSL
jgi:ornithine cyclodeaminase/alanine dehydrogenase-like protein (mu-crystallin family)